MSNKITLKEFFESKEKLAIHCNTEYKANKLLKEFDKLGKVWFGGDEYTEYNDYHLYKNNTCYDNRGKFGSLSSCLKFNYKTYDFDDIIFEEQPKNLIPLIAKELGVEIGERFFIGLPEIYFYFNENDLKGETLDGEELPYKYNDVFLQLLRGKSIIRKLPQKPKLTEDEIRFLKYIQELDLNYIIRIKKNNLLGFYKNKPMRNENGEVEGMGKYIYIGWAEEIGFEFVKVEDEEPYNIEELLKGE